MTTSTHTPGPWRTEIGDRALYHIHERRLILARREGDPDGVITIAKMSQGFTDNSEADARLIAAAPDLLAALKTAAQAINPPDIGGIALVTWNDRLKAATVAINAAIAKAEGRA